MKKPCIAFTVNANYLIVFIAFWAAFSSCFDSNGKSNAHKSENKLKDSVHTTSKLSNLIYKDEVVLKRIFMNEEITFKMDANLKNGFTPVVWENLYKKFWTQTEWNELRQEYKSTGVKDWRYYIEKYEFEIITIK